MKIVCGQQIEPPLGTPGVDASIDMMASSAAHVEGGNDPATVQRVHLEPPTKRTVASYGFLYLVELLQNPGTKNENKKGCMILLMF